MQTVNRGWIKRMIEHGKVEARCLFRLTDDYSFDNADGFGKTDWMPARISAPQFDPETNRCINSDFAEGAANFHAGDFKTKSGGSYRNDDGTITLRIHGNEVYALRITI